MSIESFRRGTVMDILRYPVLRSKTLIMYFNWFASSFMLYGLSLNWQHLTGIETRICAGFVRQTKREEDSIFVKQKR
jgi:hypothetical protein